MVVLGSREQMCVNPKVKQPNSTASDVNHDCNKMAKDRRCRYRNNLDNFSGPPGETTNRPVAMDMEDLVQMGKESTVCPFYYTRSQVETAELILVPYNYIFDKDARATTLAGVPWQDSVIIFDEAHNLESFASESASFDLSNQDVAGCIHEVDRAINYLQMEGQGTSHGVKIDNLIRMKAVFLQLEDYLLNLPTNRTAYSGDFIMEVFERGAHITHGRYELFIDQIRRINDFLMDVRGVGGSSKGSPRLEHFATCLKRVFGHQLESKCLAKAGSYRVHVSAKATDGAGRDSGQKPRNQKPTRTVSYWCFAPSIAMEELRALKVRSIIVTSGTLSPLASYAMELGLPFPHTLENPHIIEKQQILVRVVGKGVSGKSLSSSYERRKDGEYYTELGNTLISLAKVTPAGMLVFFPSYGVMNTCLERWGGPTSNGFPPRGQNQGSSFFAPRRRQQAGAGNKYSFPHAPSMFFDQNSPSTPWKRLLGAKSIVVEPKTSADLPDAISEFHRYLKLPRSTGCILMGVCRGKISEGIDFSHEQSRAVVITGLPFPPSHDPKVKMKRDFLEDALRAGKEKASDTGGFDNANNSSVGSKLSGNDWYTQQAHRAVNQAIGRVIRNSSDYGAVLLLDARFEQSRNQEGLSKWLRPHIEKDTGVGATIRSLVMFYKEAGALVEAKKKAQDKESVELKYEDEPEETLTKFAAIRPSSTTDGDTDRATNVYVAPEQVILRGDLRDQEERCQHSQDNVFNKQLPPQKRPSNNFNPLFDTKLPDNIGQKKRGHPPVPSNGDSPAQQFLREAQQRYSNADLSTIKKALVAMAAAKKGKDLRAFTPPAKHIVDIIVDHKGFSLRGSESEASGNLLLMFFQLLTSPYREEVEANIAYQVVFDKSTFGVKCKETLDSRQFGLARSYTVELLRSLWGDETSKGTNKMEDYLAKAQEIFRCFFKKDVCCSSSVLSSFTELVPVRYGMHAKALFDEVAASFKVDKLRQLDRSTNRSSLKATEITNGNPGSGQCAEKPKPEVSTCGTAKNPYARKRPAADPPAARAAASVKPRKTKLSLSSLIEKMESDTYVKASPAVLAEKLKSNAPTNIDCPVCSSSAKEPLVAECGHVACLPCWKGWLKRSQTCPTCRAAACFSSLARVVYESGLGGGNGSGATSKSTAVASDAHESEDDGEEDELEITNR